MRCADLGGMPQTVKPKTVHLYPKAAGWMLVVTDGDEPEGEAREFPELGLALDAATVVADGGVRVVVHESGAA